VPTVANSAHAAGLSHFLYLLAINYDLSEEHVVYPTFERLAPTAKALLHHEAVILTLIPMNYNGRSSKLLSTATRILTFQKMARSYSQLAYPKYQM
jgi:hypothetical protein